MILILSSPTDFSTDRVIDWLDYLGGAYLRVQPKDILKPKNGIIIPFEIQKHSIEILGRQINLSQINVVWHRKWHFLKDISGCNIFNDAKNNEELSDILKLEYKTISDYLFCVLNQALWLDNFVSARASKISQLNYAKKAGLLIPETIITSHKVDVKKFADKHNIIVTKAIENGIIIRNTEYNFQSYTSVLNYEDINDLPEIFFPSLFQQYIEKEIEIRVFYFNEALFSMAIFSQNDAQTTIDFRKYNYSTPVRTVPFKLPRDIIEKIKSFMNDYGLRSGSLDLIKTHCGKYYFLEVNPAGQYEMTNQPCNYNLDKIIAEFLIQNDYEESKRKPFFSKRN